MRVSRETSSYNDELYSNDERPQLGRNEADKPSDDIISINNKIDRSISRAICHSSFN